MQIVPIILNAYAEHLKQIMQDDIAKTDLTYADTVKVGLLQENKLQKNVALGILGGDHDDPNYADGIVSLDDHKNIAMKVPPREIGGPQYWWRRFTILVECFFIRESLTELEAFDAGYIVLGRVLANIENLDFGSLEADEFNERALFALCYGNTYFESGGPPRSFIFRGKVRFSVLTQR